MPNIIIVRNAFRLSKGNRIPFIQGLAPSMLMPDMAYISKE